MGKINQLARRIIFFDSILLSILALVFIVPIAGWFVGHMGLWILEQSYLLLIFLGGVIKGAFLYGSYILGNGFDISKQASVDFYNFAVTQVLNVISHISLYIPKLQFAGGSYVLEKMGFGILLFLVSFGIPWVVKNLNWIRNRKGVDFDAVLWVSLGVVIISMFGAAFQRELNYISYFCSSIFVLSLLFIFLLRFFVTRSRERIEKWRKEYGVVSLKDTSTGWFIRFKGLDEDCYIKYDSKNADGIMASLFLLGAQSRRYLVFAEDFYVREQVLNAVAEIKKVIDDRANKGVV